MANFLNLSVNDINFIKLQLNLPGNVPLTPVDNTGIRDVQGVGNNVFNGTTPTVQWHDLEAARAAGAQVIDVRSPAEHAAGHIAGTVNIPVDDLRERLSEVQIENVVVYCAVGQRGHIATQILKAHGANVRNLDGGYTTYSTAQASLNN